MIDMVAMDAADEIIRIGIVGVGGAGSNCVSRVYNNGISSAKTISVNTDKAHLRQSGAHQKIYLGNGLGAGGDPKYARKIGEYHYKEFEKALEDLGLVFIAAGMGGGTGTGIAPLIARAAKEVGAVTVAMVTFPFKIERSRQKLAHDGIQELIKETDTVIVIDNNKLLDYAPNLPINQAFELADNILGGAVRGISDTVMYPSLMNIDYADLKAVLSDGRLSMISVGKASGNEKVQKAVRNVVDHPLLDVNLDGAKGALVHLEGSPDLTLGEAMKAGELLTNNFDDNSEVKIGARISNSFEPATLSISTVITGVSSPNFFQEKKESNEPEDEFEMTFI